MKVLITGSLGFVARHATQIFAERGASVFGVDRVSAIGNSADYVQLDMMDGAAVKNLLADVKPDAILHLAAVSSVGQSWQAPRECFQNNTTIFLNVLETVRQLNLKTRILSVGSSEVYGDVPLAEIPLKETREVNPISPYAVSRVAQEMLAQIYVEGYGLDIVMTRSFNHTGPGQDSRFVIPSFLRQLIDIKQAGGAGVLTVGNLDVVRDFTDVRDVVDAYWKLLQQGVRGRIYNVCSGQGRSLREVISMMSGLLDVNVSLKVDPALIRPTDTAVIIGDNSRMKNELNWSPQYSFEQTLRDMMS